MDDIAGSGNPKLGASDRKLITLSPDSFRRPKKGHTGPKVLDLFAGAGSFSLGFELAGAHTVAAIEIDAWACETLELNHPRTKVLHRNIATMTDDEILGAGAGCDIVTGGPPCQGFSIANRNAADLAPWV